MGRPVGARRRRAAPPPRACRTAASGPSATAAARSRSRGGRRSRRRRPPSCSSRCSSRSASTAAAQVQGVAGAVGLVGAEVDARRSTARRPPRRGASRRARNVICPRTGSGSLRNSGWWPTTSIAAESLVAAATRTRSSGQVELRAGRSRSSAAERVSGRAGGRCGTPHSGVGGGWREGTPAGRRPARSAGLPPGETTSACRAPVPLLNSQVRSLWMAATRLLICGVSGPTPAGGDGGGDGRGGSSATRPRTRRPDPVSCPARKLHCRAV